LRDHPKLTIAEFIAVTAFALAIAQLHLGLWTTVYLAFALDAGCCVSAFAALGGMCREPPHTGR
jgi:hypothetical protein